MAISFVQVSAQTQVSSVVFSIPNTVGNCIVVFIAAVNTGGGGLPLAVTDTQGNTYTPVGPALVGNGANGTDHSQVFIAKNIIGGSGNTVSYSPGFGVTRGMMAVEYSGASKANPVLSEASAFVSGTSLSVSLTTKLSDLVILFTMGPTPAQTTLPAGYTFTQRGPAVGNTITWVIYDAPSISTSTGPFLVTSTVSQDTFLWGVVLDNPSGARTYAFEM